ncbi:TRAP-type uncharacterized transport system substrate-binding protein [Natronocella acetinitrilica]|uniref:TRAP-type uncharacterized transport system substrate-binding protein n=1 Tax=Natronocella acetinitrilica TaxID=414046 RepID=A0AAE3KCT5_9GAMM|nr:TAXI family TRAP transporter solute-binding subunit [Natronocella acetinitrilica]MCP1675408.1 TRAP-type uncharacterized transport system substrate-binding protein [Natronocella acetinitrilica]
MKTLAVSTVAGLAVMGATLLTQPQITSAQEVTQLRWATSATGSAGHRAKVNLMAVLNREMDNFNINVMPTPGAIATIRGYAMGEFDGYYGADIAFNELANDTGRFEGFRDRMEREPVQSFWAYTMEVGLAVRASDLENYSGWGDLAGSPVFTGPAPWDVRAQLERAMNTLEVGHEYRELDLGLAGSSLDDGTIDAFIAYTASESSVAPWVAEAELSVDMAILNPNESEVQALRDAGMEVVSLDPGVFQSDVHVDEVMLVPFFYGFHLGPDVSEEDMYNMLVTIEENAEELARADSVFAQIRDDMPEMQRRGVEASINDVRVHPGLARYMRERDVWNSDWDDRIAD